MKLEDILNAPELASILSDMAVKHKDIEELADYFEARKESFLNTTAEIPDLRSEFFKEENQDPQSETFKLDDKDPESEFFNIKPQASDSEKEAALYSKLSAKPAADAKPADSDCYEYARLFYFNRIYALKIAIIAAGYYQHCQNGLKDNVEAKQQQNAYETAKQTLADKNLPEGMYLDLLKKAKDNERCVSLLEKVRESERSILDFFKSSPSTYSELSEAEIEKDKKCYEHELAPNYAIAYFIHKTEVFKSMLNSLEKLQAYGSGSSTIFRNPSPTGAEAAAPAARQSPASSN